VRSITTPLSSRTRQTPFVGGGMSGQPRAPDGSRLPDSAA
jgi:hypothetical protein